MNEQGLSNLIAAVATGRLSRRAFVKKMAGLGLAAPFASLLLADAGLAQAPALNEYKPTKAGGGGALKTLYWQAVTLLNPHFAVGTKDQEGSRIFYEPLAGWDADGATWFRSSPPRSRATRTAVSRRRPLGRLEAQTGRQMA